jgi:hypothetical protein
MKVGKHTLTLHAKDRDKELVGEFIFYAVDPPNRGQLNVPVVMFLRSHLMQAI